VIKYSSVIGPLSHATLLKRDAMQEQMPGSVQPLQDTLTSG